MTLGLWALQETCWGQSRTKTHSALFRVSMNPDSDYISKKSTPSFIQTPDQVNISKCFPGLPANASKLKAQFIKTTFTINVNIFLYILFSFFTNKICWQVPDYRSARPGCALPPLYHSLCPLMHPSLQSLLAPG